MLNKKDQLKRLFQRKLGLIKYSATLGDATGIIYDDPVGRPGMVRVRYTTAAGLSLPPVVRMRGVLNPQPGMPCKVGYDSDGQLAVVEADFAGQLQSGFNPLLNNPADPNVYGKTNQSEIVTLLCHANSTPTTPSLTVTVKSYFRLLSGTWGRFEGKSDVDLSAFVPAAGSQRVVGIFLKTDYTLETFASTALATLTPTDLGIADIQEIQAQTTAGSIPVWFWRLYGGQTAIVDKDSFLDSRQFINDGSSGSGTTNLTQSYKLAYYYGRY